MTKKIIGISSNIVINTSEPFNGSMQLRLFYEYVQSVIDAGGIPIILPNTTDLSIINSYINIIDGLILTGGSDINPLKYGEEPKRKLGHVSNERDSFEFYLLEQAIKNNIPILGICRGIQIINVFSGGSLYQDILYIKDSYIKHVQDSEPNIPSHSIYIYKDTNLYKILGNSALVNSYHHLAIKDLAPNFKVSAVSKDGVIEGIENTTNPFIMGIQWHPELLTKNYDNMLNLFKYFIEKC